jgi:hypothetical protein
MSEINHFKFYYYVRLYSKWCSGDLSADVDHLYIKRMIESGFVYIVIEDFISFNLVVAQ